MTSIDYEELQRFAKWRAGKMGREPIASTLNTHHCDLNRVFEEAIERCYMNRSHVPVLINKGRGSTRRLDFSADEFRKLIRTLPSWIDKGLEGKSREMRDLVRGYVLILANIAIRHGTKADNLRWKHITLLK